MTVDEKKLLISIIIPCFNCEKTLTEAVESCYIQGFTTDEFEIILVDDKSEDTTFALMNKLATKFTNIKVFSHEINKGGGATRNTATEKASAELVFCLDSDDILSANMLKAMVDMQHATGAQGIAIETSIKFKNTDVTDIAFVTKFGYRNQVIPVESLLERNKVMCPLYSTFLYTKTAFATFGGYPTNHGFDTQGIAWRFLAHGLKAFTCPDTVYYHRVHFNESYYLRERNAGRINSNWKKILLENNAILSEEAFQLVLNFNERNFTLDIMGALKKLPNVFVSTPKYRSVSIEDLISKKAVPHNSLRGKAYRLQSRYQRMLQKITSSVYLYSKFVIDHIKARHPLYVLFAWHGQRLQKLLGIGFFTQIGHDSEIIDLYLVTTSKDFPTLRPVIEAAKKHVCHNIANIYIVARKNEEIMEFCLENRYHFVDEDSVLGYSKNSIDYHVNGQDRSGWLFQQLLKFNGDTIVQSENYLSICTDTVLIQPHRFIVNDKIIFRQNEEWHTPYFKNFKKIFGYRIKSWFSYTSHMMLFNKTMMRELKAELEIKHPGQSWDNVYTSTKSPDVQSCISDYDTYANWVRCNYPNRVKNIPLYNRTLSRTELVPLMDLERKYAKNYHSVSFHAHATPDT